MIWIALLYTSLLVFVSYVQEKKDTLALSPQWMASSLSTAHSHDSENSAEQMLCFKTLGLTHILRVVCVCVRRAKFSVWFVRDFGLLWHLPLQTCRAEVDPSGRSWADWAYGEKKLPTEPLVFKWARDKTFASHPTMLRSQCGVIIYFCT